MAAHDDQGLRGLDGSTLESAPETLMRPISVAVEIVEPQKIDPKHDPKLEEKVVQKKKWIMNGRGTIKAARTVHKTPADLAGERESQAIRGEYLYGGMGLLFGVTAIVGGLVLAMHGLVDGSSWTAQLINLRSGLRDSGPGVILFLVGVLLLWTTRPIVRLKDLRRAS